MGICDCCCYDGLWPVARLINRDVNRCCCPERPADDWAWDSLFRDFGKVTFKRDGCKCDQFQDSESWQEKKLGCKVGPPRNYGRIAEMTRCTGCTTDMLKQIMLEPKDCSQQDCDWYVEPTVPYCKFPPDPPCQEYDEDLWNRLGQRNIPDEYWLTDEWMKGLNDLYNSVVGLKPGEEERESYEVQVTEEGEVVIAKKKRRSSSRRRRRRSSIRRKKRHSRPSRYRERESETEPESQGRRYTVNKIMGYPSQKFDVEGRKSRIKVALIQDDPTRQSAPLHIAFSGEVDPRFEREHKPRLSYVGSNVYYGRDMREYKSIINKKDWETVNKLQKMETEDPDGGLERPSAGSSDRPSRAPRIAFRSQIDARLERETKPRMSYVGSNVFYGREMKRNSEVNRKVLPQFQNNALPRNSNKAKSAAASGVSIPRSEDPYLHPSYSRQPSNASKRSSKKFNRGIRNNHSTAAMHQMSSYGASDMTFDDHNVNLDASEDYFETPIQVKRLSMVAPPPAFVPITSSIRRMLDTKPGKSLLRRSEDERVAPPHLKFRNPTQQQRPQRPPRPPAERKNSNPKKRKSR